MAYHTIEYPGIRIMHEERIIRQPYVGFISPNGTLVDFNDSISNSRHDSKGNPLSNTFLKYISYVDGTDVHEEDSIKKYHPEKVIMKQVDGYKELIYRGWFGGYDGFDSFENILSNLEYEIKRLQKRVREGHFCPSEVAELGFKYALLKFFVDAYKDKDFFRIIGRVIRIPSEDYIRERLREQYDPEWLKDYENKMISEEVEKYLMSYFKDICVMYLGHDSIETFQANGEPIKRAQFTDTMLTPRIITSARYDIYERYFNCLIMEWVVHRIPRYSKDGNGIYHKQSELFNYYETSREREFKEEIEKIKKKVPLKDRFKYFIKP